MRRELTGCKPAPTEPHLNKVAKDDKEVCQATLHCSLCHKQSPPASHNSHPQSMQIGDEENHKWKVSRGWNKHFPWICTDRLWYHPEDAPRLIEQKNQGPAEKRTRIRVKYAKCTCTTSPSYYNKHRKCMCSKNHT